VLGAYLFLGVEAWYNRHHTDTEVDIATVRNDNVFRPCFNVRYKFGSKDTAVPESLSCTNWYMPYLLVVTALQVFSLIGSKFLLSYIPNHSKKKKIGKSRYTLHATLETNSSQ
jgi:hypothetical protein